MTALESELKSRMLDLYEHWKRFGPPKNYFLRMVNGKKTDRVYKGPVRTIRHLLSKTISTGFLDIIGAGHPELTIEKLILDPRWKPLFHDWGTLSQLAQARLNQAKNSN